MDLGDLAVNVLRGVEGGLAGVTAGIYLALPYINMVTELTVPNTNTTDLEHNIFSSANGIVLPHEMGEAEYLHLANSYVFAFASKEWVCKDFARLTFQLYHQLIRKDGRDDLASSINLVGGWLRNPIGVSDAHAWIEVVGAERRVYETTVRTPPIQTVGDLRTYTVKNGKKHFSYPGKYIPWVVFNSLDKLPKMSLAYFTPHPFIWTTGY